jgi:aspartyl-tRNA(Asn)/glutamyl-tRNA(Gln) amidotransferase subunit B
MRFARQAIDFEVQRQTAVLQSGGAVEQETRGFDAASGKTYALREKEQAHDYRYFPEPDLPPARIAPETLEQWKKALPALPWDVENLLVETHGIPRQDARLICQEKATADYLLYWLRSEPQTPARGAANLLVQKLMPWCAVNGLTLPEIPVPASLWSALLLRIENGVVSPTAAYQHLLPAMLSRQSTVDSRQSEGRSPKAEVSNLTSDFGLRTSDLDALIDALGLRQDSDDDFLAALAEGVLAAHPGKVEEYRKGKKGLIGFFMGELMKAGKGKADPKAATRVLTEKLEAFKS